MGDHGTQDVRVCVCVQIWDLREAHLMYSVYRHDVSRHQSEEGHHQPNQRTYAVEHGAFISVCVSGAHYLLRVVA